MENYKDLVACRALVVEKTQLPAASDLSLLLTISAGKVVVDEEQTDVYYRPYYVAALQLKTRPNQLRQGDGATFLDPVEVIRMYLSTQKSIDQALGLDIPAGFEAIPQGTVDTHKMRRA